MNVEEEIPNVEKLLKAQGANRILDFGVGTGRHALYFAKRGYEVFGFDQSSDALREAQSNLGKENLRANLRIWNMTSLPLPYENSFFDAMIIVKVIHHNLRKNLATLVSEIDRILKPRGVVFLQEPAYHRAFGEDGSPLWDGCKLLEPGTIVSESGRERGVPRHYFKKEEILELFAGYELLEYHENSGNWIGHCAILMKEGS